MGPSGPVTADPPFIGGIFLQQIFEVSSQVPAGITSGFVRCSRAAPPAHPSPLSLFFSCSFRADLSPTHFIPLEYYQWKAKPLTSGQGVHTQLLPDVLFDE